VRWCINSMFGVALLAASVATVPVHAAEFFPPQTFTLESGKPQQFSYSFEVTPASQCGGRAVWSARVSSAGVTSAQIRLNGVTVARESDFQRETFDVPLVPAVQNVLVVDLKGGRPGGTVTIAIHREIAVPLGPPSTFTLSGGQEGFSRDVEVPDPASRFELTIINGDASGTMRVKSAKVSINGTEVVSEDELNSTTGFLRRPVSLTSSSRVLLTARGGGGETMTMSLLRVLDPATCATTVSFRTPTVDETVSTATLFVTGEATGPRDIGVTVNGSRAELDWSNAGTATDPFTWFAEVPASPGEVRLVARAATLGGAGAEAERIVQFHPAADAVEVTASPRTGVPPLTADFNVFPADAQAIVRYEIDFDGDGLAELSQSELPMDLRHTYDTPGQRTITARCVREDGSVLIGTAHVMVHSWVEIDRVLRPVWTRFTAALAAGDVDGAVRELGASARDKYEGVLRSGSQSLPAYSSSISGFHPVAVDGDTAHYLLVRTVDGRQVGFHVYFARGGDGVWRLLQF
jgi:hypothetical protein